MYIIKTRGRRGPTDTMWTVNGRALFLTVEDAVDVAIDVLRDSMQIAPARSLWTVYA